jgi:hypothetical protein
MMKVAKHKNEKGYTLLEYCAGAAIIAGILWTGLNALGGDLVDLLGSVGQWAQARSGNVVTN